MYLRVVAKRSFVDGTGNHPLSQRIGSKDPLSAEGSLNINSWRPKPQGDLVFLVVKFQS